MRRRTAIGILFVLVGTVLVILTLRAPQPGTVAPAPEEAPAVEPRSQEPSERAPPLTLMPAEVAADEEVEHGALRGRVVSWGDGKGVAGAEVSFAHAGATHGVVTGADGRFELVAPEPGRYELAVVSAERFLPFAPEWGHSPVVFNTQPGQRIAGITIYLTPALLYRGVVESPGGEPVAGATVRVVGGEGGGMSLAPELEPVTTDLRGAFAIAAPDYSLLEATHPDWKPGRARIDFSVQVSHSLRIRLGPPAAADVPAVAISGRVVADGAPVDGALVTARYSAPNPAAPAAQLRASGRAVTGVDGSFEVAGLDPGTYALTARARGFAPAVRPVVRAGTTDLVLNLAPGLKLRGTVTDAATGAPIPTFALMFARVGGRRRVESVLDAAGRYEVSDLAAGTYRVSVAAYGYATSDIENVAVSPGRVAELDFALTAGGRVHGVVVDEVTNEPLAGARVSCETGLPAVEAVIPIAASALTDMAGRFELLGVASGLRSIVVAAAGHHGRIISGLDVEDDGDIGPLTIGLAPVAEGEQPSLELTGIGAVLSHVAQGFMVGETLTEGGAALAGLSAGDVITAIDGMPAGDLEFTDAIERIRGIEGSVVTLTVDKAGSGEEIEIEVTRRRVRR